LKVLGWLGKLRRLVVSVIRPVLAVLQRWVISCYSSMHDRRLVIPSGWLDHHALVLLGRDLACCYMHLLQTVGLAQRLVSLCIIEEGLLFTSDLSHVGVFAVSSLLVSSLLDHGVVKMLLVLFCLYSELLKVLGKCPEASKDQVLVW
jgi:hypothetical protein